jgi:hypothetical protein
MNSPERGFLSLTMILVASGLFAAAAIVAWLIILLGRGAPAGMPALVAFGMPAALLIGCTGAILIVAGLAWLLVHRR